MSPPLGQHPGCTGCPRARPAPVGCAALDRPEVRAWSWGEPEQGGCPGRAESATASGSGGVTAAAMPSASQARFRGSTASGDEGLTAEATDWRWASDTRARHETILGIATHPSPSTPTRAKCGIRRSRLLRSGGPSTGGLCGACWLCGRSTPTAGGWCGGARGWTTTTAGAGTSTFGRWGDEMLDRAMDGMRGGG